MVCGIHHYNPRYPERMRQPECDVCGEAGDELVRFAARDSDRQWRERVEREGMVGHPPDMAWVCEKHAARAHKLAMAGATIDVALAKLRKEEVGDDPDRGAGRAGHTAIMTTSITVVGAVIVRVGLVLCARRGSGMSQEGLWEFPGGKVEPGEEPTEALVREIREELGCGIRVLEPVTTTTHAYDFGAVTLSTF